MHNLSYLFRFLERNEVKIRKLMLLELSLLSIPEYAWMYLYKQDSEYASNPKYAKILNMTKFWIWQVSQIASVTQSSGYVSIFLDRVLNISWVLNILGFWIWQGSEYTRITQGSKYAIAEYVWIGREYAWTCLNLR